MQGRKHTAFGLAFAMLTVSTLVGCSSQTCEKDSVTGAAVARLSQFTHWTKTHDVNGVIGETGWPPGAEWSTLTDTWAESAEKAHLPVFVWAAAPWWPADKPLAFYRGAPSSRDVSIDSAQARTFEGLLRSGLAGGVGLAEGSFGSNFDEAANYSTANPGVLGKDYTYPSRKTLQYLKNRGVKHVRLAVMWERMQPRLRGALRASEVARVSAVLRDAEALGLGVVLDLHNYGRYATATHGKREVLALGSSQLTATDLADLWRRLVGSLKGTRSLTGLGIMNEPYDLPGGPATWESASASVARAIRGVDKNIPLWISGYDWSYVTAFTGDPWIPENLGPVVYEAHQYFDDDHSGRYEESYADTDEALASKGMSRCFQ